MDTEHRVGKTERERRNKIIRVSFIVLICIFLLCAFIAFIIQSYETIVNYFSGKNESFINNVKPLPVGAIRCENCPLGYYFSPSITTSPITAPNIRSPKGYIPVDVSNCRNSKNCIIPKEW